MKEFLEVFPKVDLTKEQIDNFSTVTVDRIVSNVEKDHIRIYIKSAYFIDYSRIVEMEITLREQFFSNHGVGVNLIQTFSLSEQYTAKKHTNSTKKAY